MLFSRYIYLYRDYLDYHRIDVDNDGNFDSIREDIKNTIDDVVAQENAFKVTDLKVGGKDIMELLNVKPGPIIGQILNELFEAVIDERVTNDRDALLELARTLA